MIDVPLAREDLAKLAGCAPETVSRHLAAWRRDGVGDTGRRWVALRRPDVLGELAGLSITDDDDHPTEPTTRTILPAEGFSHPSCVQKIERQVGRLPGVAEVTVHFASARIAVANDPRKASVRDLVAAVAAAGYRARPTAF